MSTTTRDLHAAHRSVIAVLVSAASLATASIASAQSEGSASAGLEEVVVTAQKREQRAQDVPISLLVATGESLKEDQLRGLQELTTRTPNVILTKAGSADVLVIRGIGSGNNGGFEQTVATIIDGIYYGRSKTSRGALVDVERVEILRGPQTTYFGNNTIGGAFNIVTRRPGSEWETDLLTSYEFEQDEFVAEVASGGPLTETLGARLALRYGNTDGYIDNLGTGKRDPRGDDKFGRLTLAWTPSEALKLDLKIEWAEEVRRGGWGTQMTSCPPNPAFPAPGRFCAVALADGESTDFDYTRYSNDGEKQDLEAEAYVLKGSYDFGAVTLESLTGYTDFTYDSNGDNDQTARALHAFEQSEQQDQFSQELRLSSDTDGKVEWMLGAYWQDNDLSYITDLGLFFLTPFLAAPAFQSLQPFAPVGIRGGLTQKTETLSGFGSLSWHATDKLTASLGLRWSQVKKSAEQFSDVISVTGPFGSGLTGHELPASVRAAAATLTATNPHSFDLSRKDTELLPAANLSYTFGDDLTGYVSYTEGFKSGGFDQLDFSGDINRLAYDPEYVDAYEIGIKGVWRDARLRYNVAAFYSDYTDLQQSSLQVTGAAIFFSIANVGKQVSQGLEADITWDANEHLSIGADFAYLDAEFKDYPNAGCNALQQLSTPAGVQCTQDLSGTRPRFAPEYSGSLNINVTWPIGALEWFAASVTSFRTQYSVIALNDPALEQEGYTKYDLRTGLRDRERGWEIAVIGKNLSDEKTFGFASAVPATPGSYWKLIDLPRTVAVQGTLKF